MQSWVGIHPLVWVSKVACCLSTPKEARGGTPLQLLEGTDGQRELLGRESSPECGGVLRAGAVFPLNRPYLHPQRATRGWGASITKDFAFLPPTSILLCRVRISERNTPALEWICSITANGPASVMWRRAGFLSEYQWHLYRFPTALMQPW